MSKLWTPSRRVIQPQQPMAQLLQQQQQRMNMIVACCCDPTLLNPCNDLLGDITLRIAGVDIAKCACTFFAIIGSNANKVTALNVDGDYPIAGDGGGIYLYSATPGGVMTIEYYNDQTCTDLHSTCTAPDLQIQYVVNCAFTNAQGYPRIETILVSSGGLTCVAPPTPEQNANTVFWYSNGSCGGPYYHGDAVPNIGLCEYDLLGTCIPPSGMLSSGGTVQAIPV